MDRIRLKIFAIVVLVSFSTCAFAQHEKRWLKRQISILSEPNKLGRGYVRKGHESAERYVLREIKSFGLLPVTADSSYTQTYSFPVNTFPDIVSVTINKGFRKKELETGIDFLVDAASNSFNADNMKVKTIDLSAISDTAAWNETKATWQTSNRIYFLKNVDTFCKKMSIRLWSFAKQLPKGCFIIPQHGKLTWTVATDTIPATVLYIEDTVITKRIRKASVHIHSVFLPATKNKNENIMAYVPGTVKDSFIVFTAHYDHLGMMGSTATFPGASDNASGTAMLLYLANYFAAHPQHYSIAFIAFSGEEAGLLGSHYFTEHPMIPLDHIKFLTNIDIMGDATDGITVVNATEFPKEFDSLQQINKRKNYLPIIKSRGKAANSDHYFFTEAGVPSFFIYSNGGKGYYHDVFDKSSEVTLENVDMVARLLIDFAAQF